MNVKSIFFPRGLVLGVAILVVASLFAVVLTWGAQAATNPLASTAWPTYGQNVRHDGRSPYRGPLQLPSVKWTFTRANDHWGTDHRGTGIGANNTVYLAAGMAGIYAIDSNSGQMKWLFSAPNTGHETWVEFPPTIAADGTLYITSENDYIYALDPNGKELWSFRANHLHTPVSISPDGSSIHFVSEDGYLFALNRRDGTLKWRYRLGYGAYGTGRRIPVVYDTAGNLYFGWVEAVWSLTPSGQKRWSLPIQNRGKYVVGPAVSNDGNTLYFVNADALLAVTLDGKQKWQQVLGRSAFDRTPAIASDGTVYIGAEDGFVYAFNPNGTLKWKQQYLPAGGWGGGVKSNILLDVQGILYFYGKDGYVYAVSSQTKQVLWRYNSAQNDPSYPGIQLSLDADGTLYVPVNQRMTLALARSPMDAATATPTLTPTSTFTPTSTATPTRTPTPTWTFTPTATPEVLSGLGLLSNSGFEEDVEGNGEPDNWIASGANPGQIARSDRQHYEGSSSLLASSTQRDSFAVYQDVSVRPGESYSFSGWINVPTSSAWFRASVQILSLTSSGHVVTTTNARVQSGTTHGWVPATAGVTATLDVTTLRVQLKLEMLSGEVYVDGFSLVRTR